MPLACELVVDHMSARWGTETTLDSIKYVLRGGVRPGLEMGAREFEARLEAIKTAMVSREEGRAGLEKVVADCRAELLERLEWVEEVEERRRATAADRAAFDDSAEGQKRQRYEAMHARELRSALRDLRAEQERQMVDEEDAPSGPTAGADAIAPSEPTGAESVGGSPIAESPCDDRGPTDREAEGSGGEAVPGDGESSASVAIAATPSEPIEAPEADAPSEPTATGISGGTPDPLVSSDDHGGSAFPPGVMAAGRSLVVG